MLQHQAVSSPPNAPEVLFNPAASSCLELPVEQELDESQLQKFAMLMLFITSLKVN
jgi:hypothetical protein